MNYILMIAAAVMAMATSSPVTPCSGMMDILSKCLSDNGLNQTDFAQYTQGASIDPETIKKQCSQLTQYLEAYKCITSEFTRCSISDILVSSVDQTAQTMGLICNDPNIKFECITQVQQQSSQIQSCLRAQPANTATLASQTQQQRICQSAKASFQCVVNLISQCDAHTGSVMATVSQKSLSALCNETDSG